HLSTPHRRVLRQECSAASQCRPQQQPIPPSETPSESDRFPSARSGKCDSGRDRETSRMRSASSAGCAMAETPASLKAILIPSLLLAYIFSFTYSAPLMLNHTAAAWSSSTSPRYHCIKCLKADSRKRRSSASPSAFIQFRASYFFAPLVRCSAQ